LGRETRGTTLTSRVKNSAYCRRFPASPVELASNMFITWFLERSQAGWFVVFSHYAKVYDALLFLFVA